MTVYVDNMEATFGRMKMCHMIGDTADELHEMARKIGVARKWYHGDHYDISLSRKALALSHGAKQITWREAGLMTVLRRREGPDAPLVTPAEGAELLRLGRAARNKSLTGEDLWNYVHDL